MLSSNKGDHLNKNNREGFKPRSSRDRDRKKKWKKIWWKLTLIRQKKRLHIKLQSWIHAENTEIILSSGESGKYECES